jgi:hypothetical protein
LDAQPLGLKKVNIPLESHGHKVRSTLRFFENLYEEISLAEKLEDIQDEAILSKMKEYLAFLKEELKLD